MSFNSIHADIFRGGPKAWNAWRENNPTEIPDLTGIALALNERQLGPAQGGPINLKSVCFRDSFLRFATLIAADLEDADMDSADLVHARFQTANLRASSLRGALLDHADFAGAVLNKAKLSRAILRSAKFIAANLQGADLSNADLESARFDRSNLRDANLSNASLDYADFAGADLLRANLCGAKLYHAKNLTEDQLRGSLRNEFTVLPVNFQGSSLTPAARAAKTDSLHLKIETVAPSPPGKSHHALFWLVTICLLGSTLAFFRFPGSPVAPGETNVDDVRATPVRPEDHSNSPAYTTMPGVGQAGYSELQPSQAPAENLAAAPDQGPARNTAPPTAENAAVSDQGQSPSAIQEGNVAEQDPALNPAPTNAETAVASDQGRSPSAIPAQNVAEQEPALNDAASEPAQSDTENHQPSVFASQAPSDHRPADIAKGSEPTAIATASVGGDLTAASPDRGSGLTDPSGYDVPPLPIRKPHLREPAAPVSLTTPAIKGTNRRITSYQRALTVSKAAGEKSDTSSLPTSATSAILAGGL